MFFAKLSLTLPRCKLQQDIFRKRLALFHTNESGQFVAYWNKKNVLLWCVIYVILNIYSQRCEPFSYSICKAVQSLLVRYS